mmetsp:Transcript_32609/g.53553  ORF Transcript_32609/g.53553 Transcript_32609/m.53553 type:complete len:203 (-) Transcript_32609:24-632(-)
MLSKVSIISTLLMVALANPVKINSKAAKTSQAKAGETVFAEVILTAGGDSGVSGRIGLMQTGDGPVVITGDIDGLEAGNHGFHVHAEGSIGNNCLDAQGHFNPFEATHGSPTAEVRHVGDLGNIVAAADTVTEVVIVDELISLAEGVQNGIIGKAIVVHAGEDDLGLGGDDGSLATGNAGGRVACGVITKVEKVSEKSEKCQ